MKAYKGFDKDLKCRGFQFEVGKVYESDGAIRCGDKGFHACDNPLDCFDYYAPAESRYFEVDCDGKIDRTGADDGDTKFAAQKIKLVRELSLAELAIEAKNYIDEQAKINERVANPAGDRGSATAGYAGSATAGYAGSATAGDRGSATAGDRGSATAGNAGSATAGYAGSATAGDRGSATAGDRGSATAGDRGSAISRGRSGAGINGIAVARGNGVKAKGGIGALLVVAEENNCDYGIRAWKAVVVDGETIKADTYYRLVDGELTEA
jgi:hypothetical protein